MSDSLELKKCRTYLKKLCVEIPERCVGSEGNRQATSFFNDEITSLGWKTEMPEFDAIDWKDGGASLISGSENFKVFTSPYSVGCDVAAMLVSASCIEDLETIDANNKLVLLYDDIAREQLMPKNFVFFNPDRHKKIIALLESCGAEALICATGRNPDLAGGVYPFPHLQ